jgi:hypothetical protein
LRPHPPRRLSNPGDARAFDPPRALRLSNGFRPAPAETSRARGRPARAARRLSSCVAPVFHDALALPEGSADDGSFAPTRSARTPLVAKSRQHRLETPTLHDRPLRHAERSGRNDPAAQTLLSRPARKRGARVTPRTARSRETGRPTGHNAAIRLRRSRRSHRHGRLRPLARARPPGGRGPPHPSFREEDRDPPHPRCLPSTSCLVFRPRVCTLRRPVGRVLSTSCRQLWINAARLIACAPTRRL